MSQPPKKTRRPLRQPTVEDAALASRIDERRRRLMSQLAEMAEQPEQVPVGIITHARNASVADTILPRRVVQSALLAAIRQDEQQLASLGFDFVPAEMPAYAPPALDDVEEAGDDAAAS